MRNNSIVSELLRTLRELQGLELLLRVGLEKNSEKGIDLLAGCNEGDINKYAPLVESLLKDRWPSGSFFVCDDSVRFDLPMGTGGVAICDSTLLVRQIKKWIVGKNLGGQHRPWTTGYWLPEALCGDIATARILYDAKDIGIRIRKLVVPYPHTLSRSIIDLCVNEIRQKVQTIERIPEKRNPIEFELCCSDLVASIVRLVFARSYVYLRGFRSLGEQSRLLRSSDLTLYELAMKFSKRTGARNLINRIERLI